MLVVTAVSSINTRWAGSRKPCSRIQRRRARATSARFRSAARKLFFNGDAMASKKSGKRAAAAWDSPLVKRRNDLIQREVRYLADEGEDLPRVLLQWRSTPSTGHGFESPVFTKALHPPIAELTLTSNCSAASRRDPPSCTKSMARVLNSPGYGSCIGQPSGESMR